MHFINSITPNALPKSFDDVIFSVEEFMEKNISQSQHCPEEEEEEEDEELVETKRVTVCRQLNHHSCRLTLPCLQSSGASLALESTSSDPKMTTHLLQRPSWPCWKAHTPFSSCPLFPPQSPPWPSSPPSPHHPCSLYPLPSCPTFFTLTSDPDLKHLGHQLLVVELPVRDWPPRVAPWRILLPVQSSNRNESGRLLQICGRGWAPGATTLLWSGLGFGSYRFEVTTLPFVLHGFLWWGKKMWDNEPVDLVREVVRVVNL